MSFQQRLRFIIERVGGQAELARQVNARYGTNLRPQNIQVLATNNPSRGRPSQGSRYTSQFAAVGGVEAEWLATGLGPKGDTALGTDAVAHVATNTSRPLARELGRLIEDYLLASPKGRKRIAACAAKEVNGKPE